MNHLYQVDPFGERLHVGLERDKLAAEVKHLERELRRDSPAEIRRKQKVRRDHDHAKSIGDRLQGLYGILPAAEPSRKTGLIFFEEKSERKP